MERGDRKELYEAIGVVVGITALCVTLWQVSKSKQPQPVVVVDTAPDWIVGEQTSAFDFYQPEDMVGGTIGKGEHG